MFKYRFFLFFFFFFEDCDEMCSKCYGPNNDQCLTCPHETYLLNGKCLDDCPSGYYSNLTSNKCQGLFFLLSSSLKII